MADEINEIIDLPDESLRDHKNLEVFNVYVMRQMQKAIRNLENRVEALEKGRK